MLALVGLVVNEYPEGHPDKAQSTDDDECHLPSEQLCQWRNADRSSQGTYRCTGIEDRGGESTVFLGEVLSGHLNGSGEVSALSKRQDGTTEEEQINADGGNAEGCHRTCLNGTKGSNGGNSLDFHRYPSAGGMHTGAQRPYEDGPQITFLCAHPVDELTGKEAEHGIEDRENRGNGAVVGIRPMKLRCDKVFPCQRKHLTVHVVNGCCKEQHCTDNPTVVGHLRCFYRTHCYC